MPLDAGFARVLDELLGAIPDHTRLRTELAALYGRAGDTVSAERVRAGATGDGDGRKRVDAQAAELRRVIREHRSNLPSEAEKEAWTRRFAELGQGLHLVELEQRRYDSADHLARVVLAASFGEGRLPGLFGPSVDGSPEASAAGVGTWVKDRCHLAVEWAMASGDVERARDATGAWWAVAADLCNAGDHPGSQFVRWYDLDLADVQRLITTTFPAGPDVLVWHLHALANDMPWPDRGGVTRPVTAPQLVSAAITSLDTDAFGDVWATEAGVGKLAAFLADLVHNPDPMRWADFGSRPLLSPPVGIGLADHASVLVDARQALESVIGWDADGTVLGFVQSTGDVPPGITPWPPIELEELRGPGEWTYPPSFSAAAAVAELIGVPLRDVHAETRFCPPSTLPTGRGPVAVVDLTRLNALASSVGAEVEAVFGTLSPKGLQVVVAHCSNVAVPLRPAPWLVCLGPEVDDPDT